MASTSYNQTPLSWDVFLSFRGKDTGNTFTGHLYKALHRTGIHTFKVDPELRSGEVISDSLIQAINQSKTYIVVLSENYATSSWCLDELVEILDCYKRMKKMVVPLFYYIDPSVVRHQIGCFKEAFEKLQTRFEMQKVSKWRLALNEVAQFSGCHISENRSEADIVDEVVERVLLEINPKKLNVAKNPVGLDSLVKGITALFNTDTEGVIRIGIHGMGGVGKTTLAKVVYNQNYQRFQGSCFLANVREVVGMTNGLVSLQQQLIFDVLKRNFNIGNVDQGIELIRARISSTKVLVVIDDLDDPEPLEFLEGSFALGSIIIITTRNEDLKDSIKVQAKFKVNELDADQSCQLFAHHAFRDYKISDKFTELSKDILKRAGGLPLALKIFGSNLLDQPEEEWRWFIDKLNRVPIDDIEKKLLISFDALKSVDPVLQDIFIDIACFYIGKRKEEVVGIIETWYTFVNRSIDILKKRCLLTISDGGRLGMHDMLRDMGRKIAYNNSPDEPGKHSRLWVLKDIYTVLENHKGTEAIQGIISGNFNYKHEDEGLTFVAQSFKRMSKLRFLYLNNVNLTGSFEQIFEDLRWLRWVYCPLKCLPPEFYPKKVVTLELPRSKLTTTPDFTRLPCLTTLNFQFCRSLEEVHVSIGSLASLLFLDLGYCENLRSLPDSICSLSALEVLTISGCIKLDALPTKIGNIGSLKVLDAEGLNLLKLPVSIGRLSNLVELRLGGNENLQTLPSSICRLRSLEILEIYGCRELKIIPDISNLSNIDDLELSGCHNLLFITELSPGSMVGPPNLLRQKLTERLLKNRKCLGKSIPRVIFDYQFQMSPIPLTWQKEVC